MTSVDAIAAVVEAWSRETDAYATVSAEARAALVERLRSLRALHSRDEELDETHAKGLAAEAEVARLQAWVSDLQAGTYINCVYCGHRYGPDDVAAESIPRAEATGKPSMAEALRQHVATCPRHPMAALEARLRTIRAAWSTFVEVVRETPWDAWAGVNHVFLECAVPLEAHDYVHQKLVALRAAIEG